MADAGRDASRSCVCRDRKRFRTRADSPSPGSAAAAAVLQSEEDLPGRAGLQIRVVRRPARAGPRSAVDAVEVDDDRLRLRRFPRRSSRRPSAFDVVPLLRFRLVVGLSAGFSSSLSRASGEGDALAEHDQVDRTLHAHVLGRLREPLVDRAGVGRGEEVEVLAAGVEDRLDRVAQPVGDRPRLALARS